MPAVRAMMGVLGVDPLSDTWAGEDSKGRGQGIGAGASVDGQVLVWHDMADVPAGDHRATFVRKFGSIGADLEVAAAAFKRAVHLGEFPADEHAF